MATDLKQTTQQIQGQALDLVRQGQDAVIKGVQTWADAWADTVRQFVPGEFYDSAQYPNPAELIDQVFDFGEQLLTVQREFAHSVIDAASPAWKATEQATERTAKKAQK